MERVPVGGRIYRHGLYAHLLAGADNAERDFASVGYKYFVKHEFRFYVLTNCRALWFDEEEGLVVFNRAAVLNEDFSNLAGDFGFDLVEQFHRLDYTQHLAFAEEKLVELKELSALSAIADKIFSP